MTPESSEPVGAPPPGQVSGLLPTSPHKDNRRRRRPGAKGRKQKKKEPDAEADQDQLPASAEDANDQHSVDYLA